MENLNDFDQNLLEKYLQGDISKEEFEQLMQSILHKKLESSALDNLWNPQAKILTTAERNKLFENILSQAKITEGHKRRSRIKSKKWILFSSLSVTAFAMIVLFLPRQKNTEPTTTDLLPGTNASILSTSNGQVYKIDAIKQTSVVNEYDSIVNMPEQATIKYTPIVKQLNLSLASIMNTISTQKGNTYKIILPDGSKVWLNASSNLKFPVVFAGATREVTLDGEGYFEVAKDSKHPFIVHSSLQNVEVLGTHFNINAYNSNHITTTLLDGKIKLSNINNQNKFLILEPGDQVMNQNHSLGTIDNTIDTTVTVAWKNGLFAFKSTPIKEVLAEMGRWYNAEIIYQKDLPNKTITGEIYRNTKASEVLELLRYEGIQSKIEGNKIIVTTH